MEAPIYGVPAHIENWATVLAGLGALGSLAFCVRHARRNHSPLALYLYAASALAIFIEPFPDTLGHAIFAQEDRISWVSGLGRHIPMYIGLTYLFYMAPVYVTLIDFFKRGVTARRLVTVYLGMAAATVLFEVVPMHYDLWRYYGEQGPQAGKVPIWWGFVNSHGLLATAFVIYLLTLVLPRNRQALLIPLAGPVFLAVHSAGAMVGYLGVNATSDTLGYLGTIATDLVCVGLVYVYGLTLERVRPAAEPSTVGGGPAPARAGV